MKYAVISLNDNSWQFESDDLGEAEVQFLDLKLLGVPCVLVEVLRNSEEEQP